MGNKGITIIEMVVVVLILVLITIIAIWSTQRTSFEAEATLIFTELKAVHTGVLKIKQDYDLNIFEDYTSGEHYNTELKDSTDTIVPDWYIIYGMGDSRYSETVIKQLGVDELKRNYKVNFNTAEVEFLDGPVKVGEYEVNSYEDIMVLKDSGVI